MNTSSLHRTIQKLKSPLLGSFVLCLLLVFALHHSFVTLPFQGDDALFNRPVDAPGGLIPGMWPRDGADWLSYWNPFRGWLYRPVFTSYWAALWTLGLGAPAIMHALGLALHALVVWGWGWLIHRVSGSMKWGIGAAVAFAVWPGKEEAVSWLASNSTLIAVALALASVHLWLSWRQGRGALWAVGSALLYFAACCAKNEAIAFAFVFPLLDWLVLGWPGRKQALGFYGGVFALSLLFIKLESVAAAQFAARNEFYRFQLTPEKRLTSLVRFVSDMLHGALPVTLSLEALVLIPLAIVAWKLLQQQRREIQQLALFGVCFGALASLPVPLTSGPFALMGWMNGGNRFFYEPLLGWSLGALVLCVCAWRGLASTTTSRRETGSSLAAVGVLLNVPFALCGRPDDLRWLTGDVAVFGLFALVAAAALWVAFRCELLDGRMVATLLLALALVGGSAFTAWTSFDHWTVFACILAWIVWRRDGAAGALVAFGAMHNPVCSLAVLAARMAFVWWQNRRRAAPHELLSATMVEAA